MISKRKNKPISTKLNFLGKPIKYEAKNKIYQVRTALGMVSFGSMKAVKKFINKLKSVVE